MRALVVFYSRTGNTRKAAEAIAEELGCDREEIIDTRNRSGVLGYVRAGMDAARKTPAAIKQTEKDASAYGLVLIGTPVWAWTVSAPVRAYILRNRERLKKVAFFCTKGGSEGGTFKEMENLCGKAPVCVLSLSENDLRSGAHMQQVKEFAKKISKI